MNCRDEEKEQDLINFCKRGNLYEAKKLVDSGVSVKCRDKFGRTPMHWAVINYHNEVAEALLSSGASVDDEDKDGNTTLMTAIYFGNQDIVRLLIGRSDVNAQNKDGWTALMIAISNYRLEVARLLVEGGAALSQELCIKALDYALKDENYELADFFKKHMKWLSRRDFLMFLATQSYLPAAPPPLADSMYNDELNSYYQKSHNPETRPNKAVHTVFFMAELQRYITSFLGPS